ncbi:hypothetical protein [Paenibacillus sp. GCM10027626]|uniref:hypothetical protein n=1 Tax=Paenibacillus sp. GCM10027626 TaxID=3273411 RepID=UPI003633569A
MADNSKSITPKSSKPKKLSATALNKMAAKLDEKQKIIVLGEYEVNLQQTWRKSAIRDVILNYLDILQQLNQQDDITNTTIANSVALIDTLLVQAFTDIPFPKNKTDLNSLIHMTNVLLDNGILEEVVQAFHPDNITRFQQEFEAFQARLGEYLGDLAIKRGASQPWNQPLNPSSDSDESQDNPTNPITKEN